MLPANVILILAAAAVALAQPANEALFEAARAGDVARIEAALAQGAGVNSTSRYNVTPLIFAAGNGRLEAVKLLVARGANVNAEDSFYRSSAAMMAIGNGHADIAVFLLQNGWDGGDYLTLFGVQSDNPTLVKTSLTGKVTRQGIQAALGAAERLKRAALLPILHAALDGLPAEPATPAFAVDPAMIGRYAGTYRASAGGMTVTITVQEGWLTAQVPGQPAYRLTPSAAGVFRVPEVNATLTFNERGGLPESIQLVLGPATIVLARIPPEAPVSAAAPAAPNATADRPIAPAAPRAPRNWPSFRGEAGSGNADGQRAVTEWDVTSGKNIKWKTPIPGIANSSPIAWGNRVFVTTAISTAGDTSFRTGLYGDVKPVEDLSQHEWKVYAIDKTTGKIVWERTAFSGTPKVKRHTKATQANSTPATDGRRIVAAFGSIGLLIAWDMNGKELWRADLGILDSGWFFDPTFQWGHSSSPIIHGNAVILQADMQKGSYVAAWDVGTGKQIWKTARTDEIPTWGRLRSCAPRRDEANS